jgi:hypothetical protein
LSRLAGEGLVEDRRGQGFFVPRLTGRDIADLYRLNLAYLGWVFDVRPDVQTGPAVLNQGLSELEPPPDGASAVTLSERLFHDWVARSSRTAGLAHRKLQDQLAVCRRLEPGFITDIECEVMGLIASARRNDGPELSTRLQDFHARRIGLAPDLASRLEAQEPARK